MISQSDKLRRYHETNLFVFKVLDSLFDTRFDLEPLHCVKIVKIFVVQATAWDTLVNVTCHLVLLVTKHNDA